MHRKVIFLFSYQDIGLICVSDEPIKLRSLDAFVIMQANLVFKKFLPSSDQIIVHIEYSLWQIISISV